jgi:DNA polymerase-3 subunit delta'
MTYSNCIYPWQASQWQMFIHAWRQARLGHAYLCYGPAGTGKHHFVNTMAALLLCQTPVNASASAQGWQPCQACQACRLFQAGNHPDFHRVMPEANAQFIKIDQVRALNHSLAQSSHQAGRHCVVISPAETLNIASQNALLKTLEEPSSDSVILLVSSQPELLAPTIRSRCQSIYFSAPDLETARSWLEVEKNINSAEATVLCQLSAGAPLHAAALHNSDYFNYRQAVFQALFHLQKSAWVSHIAEELMALSAPFELILTLLFTINFDCWRLSLGVPVQYLFHQDQVSQLSKITKIVEILKIPRENSTETSTKTRLNFPEFLTKLLRAIHEYKTSAVNESLMLETLLLHWQKMRTSHAC